MSFRSSLHPPALSIAAALLLANPALAQLAPVWSRPPVMNCLLGATVWSAVYLRRAALRSPAGREKRTRGNRYNSREPAKVRGWF